MINAALSLDATTSALKSIVPDAEWILKAIEDAKGWFRFPPHMLQMITDLKIEQYPLLYEDERLILYSTVRPFMTDGEIKQFADEIELATLEERGEILRQMEEAAEELVDSMVIPKTPKEIAEANKLFADLDETGKKEAILRSQCLYSFFFAGFGQLLSQMIHGEKLTSLVAQAKNENVSAFMKAVQIDARILSVIPYFRDRHARARAEGDQDFLDKLAYRIKAPPYQGKIRHKSLFFVLALLDQIRHLESMTHQEILDVCDAVGVGGAKNRLGDVKYVGKRLKEFREFRRRGVASTP